MPVDLMSEPLNPDDGANDFGVRVAMLVVTIVETDGKHETRGRFACHIVRNGIFPHAEKSMRICLQ